MNDLISRQDAIESIERTGLNEDEKDTAIRVIENLPSAQQKIIRCKDCLMHSVCRFEQGLGLEGYCSQAKEVQNDNATI